MTGAPELRTAQALLRPLRPGDAPDIAEGIAEWRVMRWLSAPPWPYGLADAEWFVTEGADSQTFGIEVEGRVVGVIGAGAEFGYWLAPPLWGQGIMSEVAAAVLAWRFGTDPSPLDSGYFLGNGPSRAVLTKHGFVPTRIVARYHRPSAQALALQEMVLTREAWEAR
ncbi:GNAT family N-acetyltransferase [Pseudoroseicyclus tamaricis]|uniref:GNAT family N-acetyltransferase n=1 Tax=Pseudoroseicyclus tamaricis TaxID=2705421 RepID=A0A6B2JI83_9RHOB|nr:GNAT family N-acetyltransferase [Pseudoroseicyclus tamaricis]NDV01063.1 GNAT family N-acetyltransferase [Pseudoroseicyclus tamaricis]